MTFRTPPITFASFVAVVVALGSFSATASYSRAQEPGNPPPKQDEALDDLFKDLDKEKDTPKTPKAEPAKADQTKPQPKADSSKPKPPAPAEVKDRDKDVDSLLEKLGESEDKPTQDDPSDRGGMPPPPPPDDKPEDDPSKSKDKDKGQGEGPLKPDPLTGKAKDLDEHLSDLSGQRRKKKGGDDGEGSGPLSDVVKEMRDVEQRLGKTDTGEATRKKQQSIVKNLETLIQQLRAESSSSKNKKQLRISMKPGEKPGEQPSETPGNTGGNAPFAKPAKPTNEKSLANSKDAWGHLPPELRQEMENVVKEEPLPAREELIRRYYLSVSKKSLNRGE